MVGALQVVMLLPWNHLHHHNSSLFITPHCALSKQSHRLFISLDAVAGDPSASHRLIRKFVASSSKSISLNALSHLLSTNTTHPHLSSLSLPIYRRITETSWFIWNPKLVASVIALLDKQGQFEESDALILESVQKLGFRKKDTALFYCDLIDSFSKHGSKRGVFNSYSTLNQIFSDGAFSSSSSVIQRAYKSMINGLCVLDLPQNAEEVIEEMGIAGFKPSDFEFRSVVHGYGRLGLFNEMRRVVCQMEDAGYAMDTICSNIVLSSYGDHGQLSEMVSLLQKMSNSNIPFSIRTYNSVLNSCPTILSLLREPKFIPLSIEELIKKLQRDEALLVQQLIGSSVLVENLKWCSSEGKLDLHGMHLGSAYLIMLQWVEHLKSRFSTEDSIIPAEISVVCGLGKHSIVRGESPVKALVKEMMFRMKSPMKIDRKNVGCFSARGRAVKEWLSTLNGRNLGALSSLI